MNRAERAAAYEAKAIAKGPYKSLSDCPNTPCDRCFTPISTYVWGGTTHLMEHTMPNPRTLDINLCPKCFTDLINWLDLDPS